MTEPPMALPPATEFAPSVVSADEPTVARLAGLVGFLATVLGVAAVIANQYGDRFITAPLGYLIAAGGLFGMLFHAARDGELETRRMYMGFGLALLIAGVVAAFVPGPLFGEGGKREAGHHFLPWTPTFALLGLIFQVVPLRHETDEKYRNAGLTLLFMVGAILAVGSIAFGIARPDTLEGRGVLLAVVGLGFLAAFLANVETADGPGYLVAVLLGVVGGGALAYAVARSAFPTVLHEGPTALRNSYQTLDYWKAAARGAIVLACLGFAVWAGLRWRAAPGWVRAAVAALGVGFAGVFVVGSFAAPVHVALPGYLVPHGLLLAGIGVLYLIVSVGTVSDSQFVTLTRRELSSYFASPIAYFVLLGTVGTSWLGYMLYIVFGIQSGGGFGPQPIPEPVLKDYYAATLIGPVVMIGLVPALTMRLFSEEKRTGTLEMLLTAPVNEGTVVLSKLVGCWLFYMLLWVPMGLYLIALRVEGGSPFDYKPLISLYLMIGVTGLAVLSMGLFFSALTNSQIVAFCLTGAVMLALWVMNWLPMVQSMFPRGLRELFELGGRLSYWKLWSDSLAGQVVVRDILAQGSLAVLWTFLTVRVLEARKWA